MFNGKMMTGLGSSEYELMTGWPDYRTTYKSRNGVCGKTRIGVERKKHE